MCPSRQVQFELAKCYLTDSIVNIKSAQENGVVNGIKCGREIQKGKGSDRPFGHMEKNIVINIKESTFSRMVFSISQLEGSHKAVFIKVSL